MTMTRYGRRLVPLRDAMDQWLADPLALFPRGWLGDEVATPWPPMDVRETGDAYVVEADLPGVRAEDVDVTLDGRTLLIQGTTGAALEERDETYLIRERRSGRFSRALTLAGSVEADAIECTFEAGELRLRLPKAASGRARRIPVGGGPAASPAARRSSGEAATPPPALMPEDGPGVDDDVRAGETGTWGGTTAAREMAADRTEDVPRIHDAEGRPLGEG
ncbi:MAG TPA: Hsp20/alpha crystallin family protein [Candidatus Limnocylindrales bacterium]